MASVGVKGPMSAFGYILIVIGLTLRSSLCQDLSDSLTAPIHVDARRTSDFDSGPMFTGQTMSKSKNTQQDFIPLCDSVQTRVDLRDSEYEYRPPFYHEVFCKGYFVNGKFDIKAAIYRRQTCVHPRLVCVQRTRTLAVSRRKHGTNCWMPYLKTIGSGCDCMWPSEEHGNS